MLAKPKVPGTEGKLAQKVVNGLMAASPHTVPYVYRSIARVFAVVTADRFYYLHGGRAVPELRQGPAKGHEDKPWAKGVASTSALRRRDTERLDRIVWLACQTED